MQLMELKAFETLTLTLTSFYSNLVKMVDYYDLNYDFSCNSLSDSIVNRYIGIMKNKYVSYYWNQTLQQSQKISLYCTIKDDYSPSPYLVLTRKNPSRKALLRFTITSHQLRIETGRYENTPRNERICHFCTSNKIKDENPWAEHLVPRAPPPSGRST